MTKNTFLKWIPSVFLTAAGIYCLLLGGARMDTSSFENLTGGPTGRGVALPSEILLLLMGVSLIFFSWIALPSRRAPKN